MALASTQREEMDVYKTMSIAVITAAAALQWACAPPQTPASILPVRQAIACDEARLPNNDRSYCMDWVRGDGTIVRGPVWTWEFEAEWDKGIQPPKP